jgi:Fe-S-cluster containining protein
MNIRDLAFDLQKVYEEMSEAFGGFQSASGLSCLSGCGGCCKNPEIEASLMEMLPWAVKTYDAGEAETWLERLQSSSQASCVFLVNERCTSYHERPSVCRMFGVSGYFDKHHQKTLSICKLIREANELKASSVSAEESPVMAIWFSKVSNLGSVDDNRRLPINKAMIEALKKVLTYYSYA